jgi:PAS domain S-box-containing protein
MNEQTRILVVDDDPQWLSALARILRCAGYMVLEADCGEAALEALEFGPRPDLMLVDVNLPGMSGVDVCQCVKEDDRFRSTFVVLISAQVKDTIRQAEALEGGADGYITRPISNRELLARLEAFIRIREAECALRWSQEREAHIKQVLLGIRNVNQLIVQEDDPHVLIEMACGHLTEGLGYRNAWVVLLDEDGQIAAVALSAGLAPHADELRDWLDREGFPTAMQAALASNKTVVVHDPAQECPGCPLAEMYTGCAGLMRRLVLNDVLYGVLGVSAPTEYADDEEEQALFVEVAGDLAYALHAIEEAWVVQHQADQLAAILRTTQDGYWLVEPSGRLLDVNDTYCRMTGYTREELLGFSVSDLEARETPAETEQHLRRLIESQAERFESQHRARDGRLFDVEVSTSYWAGADRIIAFIRDTRDRKEAERARNETESRLRQVFDLLPIGLWFADSSGALLEGNPAGVAIWGAEPLVAPSEYGVFTARRLPSGEEIAPDDWALAHTIREGVTVVDELLEIDAFDGKTKTILNYTAPILDDAGNVQGAIVVNQDVTGQQRARDALRASEEAYRAVVENAGEAIFVVQDGSLQFMNKRTTELSGFSEHDLMTRPFTDFIHPDDRAIVYERHILRQQGAMLPDRYAFRIVTPADVVLWVELNVVQIEWNGRPATLNFLADITERRQSEAKLADQLDELRRWHGVTLGRETRVQDLKREVNQLLVRMGQPPRYPSAEIARFLPGSADSPPPDGDDSDAGTSRIEGDPHEV